MFQLMNWNVLFNNINALLHFLFLLFLYLAFYLQGLVLSALCSLIVRCTNFKVRATATTAIRYVSRREHFGSQFLIAWTSLSDGLDNATNMTDFKEFKHQDNLMEQVSLTQLLCFECLLFLWICLFKKCIFCTDTLKP